MDYKELKEQLGEELCAYCPWNNGGYGHAPGAVCEGNFCEEACDAFVDENADLMDETDTNDNGN